MFSLSILIGVYSYIIFALGLLGVLYKQNIIFATVVYFLLIIIWKKNQISYLLKSLRSLKLERIYILPTIILFLLTAQILINFIGVFGPEFGFDALWYHLTFPKIYLLNHSIVYIPGGLLYYSVMPKLTEMLYIASLSFGNEILAKFVHFSFGLLSCIAIYSLSRKFLDKKLSIIAVAIFYSNLVVGWQSITAYIDLGRTFFEIMALWGFINFIKETPYSRLARSLFAKRMWLIESAVMLGLATTAKLLSLGSLLIFTTFLIYEYLSEKNKNLRELITNILVYWFIVFLIPLPWFIFSFIHTGNPVYPFFSHTYPIVLNFNLFNPFNFVKELWIFFTGLSDHISFLYIIFLPLIIIYFRKFNRLLKIISAYSLLAIILWYLTPRTGGGRFILPYLPAFSIVVAGMVKELKDKKYIYKISIVLVLTAMLFSIGYRGFANLKYVPVIIGKESKDEFLIKHLNFSFGDFYDTDGYFKKNIKSSDRVLLYGFHNLYYIEFPFIDSSWVKKGDTFNYIATQNTVLPKRFSYWNLIYKNEKTKVNLYTFGGRKWVY